MIYLSSLIDLPRLELCQTGMIKDDEACPLGLTPSGMPGPFVCVFALTRPFLIHSLPARMYTCTHTAFHVRLPSSLKVQLMCHFCDAFSQSYSSSPSTAHCS